MSMISSITIAQPKPNPVLLVAEIDILDRDSIRQFSAITNQLIPKFGGEYVSRGGKITPLADAPPRAVTILKFESLEKAQAYYNSPEYKAALPLRDKAMKYKAYLIDVGDFPQ